MQKVGTDCCYEKITLYYEFYDKEQPKLAAKFGIKCLTFKTVATLLNIEIYAYIWK